MKYLFIVLAVLFLTACSEDIDPAKDYILIGDHVLAPDTYQIIYVDRELPIIRYNNHNYHYYDYHVVQKMY